MASVVVNGDTSGSVTLSAPAVAGTVTVTLPSTSGTMATLTTPSFATTIGVGGATASASGSGITFPATQSASSNANTLDDYEEGTWTPTQGAGLTVIGTFSSGGNYTKIGNIVYLQGYVVGSTSVAFTNGATVCDGLPFTASSASPLQTGLGINAANNASAPMFAYGASIVSSGTLSATGQYHFSVFYRI